MILRRVMIALLAAVLIAAPAAGTAWAQAKDVGKIMLVSRR